MSVETINTKLDNAITYKSNIMTAIAGKGATIDSSTPLADYAGIISNIMFTDEETAETIASLQSQVETLTNQNSELNSQVTSLTTTNESLQSQLDSLTASGDEKDAQIISLTTEKENLTSQVNDLTAQLSSIDSDLALITSDTVNILGEE